MDTCINHLIVHNKPTMGILEEEAATRVIRNGWIAQGVEVEQFENELCEFLGLSDGHAVAVASGTAALYLALWALQARGKKVAFPAYSCSALRNAVLLAKAEEVLLDSSSSTPNLDITSINNRNADIVIAPHMYGLPIDLSALNGKLPIIEDCAQSLGAMANGVSVGLQADIGVYSFYATKLITSGGQGGMVVSKNKDLIDSIRDYRQFDQRTDHKARFNFQMTDIQAAIGRVQLQRLSDFLNKREEIYIQYKHSGLNLIDISQKEIGLLRPVRYRALVNTKSIDKTTAILNKLHDKKIKSIIPLEEWELLGDPEFFPNARKWTKEIISLPLYPSLSNDDVQKIISVLSEVVTN
jgi:perosamine synthetase